MSTPLDQRLSEAASTSGTTTGATLANSAVALLQTMNTNYSTVKDNADPNKEVITRMIHVGAKEKIDPDTNWSIPVVYGNAWVNGSVTDAHMSEDTITMWYCITLCEQTGTKLSDNLPSKIKFKQIIWNNQRIQFDTDGIQVGKMFDQDNRLLDTYTGLIYIYPFSGGSDKPVGFAGNLNKNTKDARELFPGWGPNHKMSNLVFMLVKVVYNADKDVTGLGDLRVRLENDMKQPGDVMYDYMTNTMYGCGLNPEQINAGEP